MAAVPGAIATARILKNQYYGLRHSLKVGTYDLDGITHRHKTVDESVSYIVGVLEDYFAFGGIEPEMIEGQTVLELGPGDSLGVALLMLGLGARRVVCVDRFLTYRDPMKERRILAALIELAPAAVSRARMKQCVDREYRIVSDRLAYVHGVRIERVGPELGGERFDLIVSRSVLEHVDDIRATYRNCRRLIKDRGMMIHKVDLSNHSTIEPHPLHFLTYSETMWRLMSSNISRVNRCRWPQHRTSLESNGFSIERFGVTKQLERREVRAIRRRLGSPFAELTDEELAINGFYMACRAVPGPLAGDNG